MKTTTVFLLFGAIAVSSAQAGSIGVDAASGVEGLSSGYGGLTLGWEFQVSATEGITVDGLGFWDDQSDGFLFSQTFPVGLWDSSTGTLLRSSVITSGSALKPALDTHGSWRVNAVAPLFLAPGLYRIGALIPESGANPIVSDPGAYQSAPGVSLVRFMRQIGSATLAMPDIGPPYSDALWFGPTFTFTPGAPAPTGKVVVPGSYATVAGTGGLNTLLRNSGNPRTYQMQFSSAALAGLPVGTKITELQFRLSTNATGPFPDSTTSWADYEVTLAQAANPVSGMSTTFALNMRSPVLVKSGALSLGADTFSAGASPNAFSSLLLFDRPYVYQGGDLVMLFRHPGSDLATTPPFLDALTTATAGYGTDFRALSATTFSATTGVFGSANIVQIVFTYSPSQSIYRDGANVVVVGSGGPPAGTYHLMTSTNPAFPGSQWTAVSTNSFDGSGTFRYTNAIPVGTGSRFFRIAMP